VPTTSGRSRGRQGVRRSGAAGPAGEHLPKVMVGLVTALIVVVLVLVMTKQGREIDAATQRFMLFYAGVFALIGLTASVGAGLLATDRIFMSPGHRVMAQAVHRAVSFGALAFLIIHIVTEILAQRVHAIDAVIPFLSPYRTFYIGLGTIASDLILALVVTSMVRKRFTAHGKAWRWRAIHYTAYAAFVLGVAHGLMAGRDAKPYVDWSYGVAIALTALALVIRFLAISLRSKRSLSAPVGADQAAGGSGVAPLRAAALSLAQAQLGATIQALPSAVGSQPWARPPAARDGFAISGPFPAALEAPRAGYAALEAPPAGYAAEAVPEAYRDPAFMPLGAPAYGSGLPPALPAVPGLTGLPGFPGPGGPGRQPRYEPGYDGPPRFEGAPRKHVPQDDLSSYPYATPSQPSDGNTGPMPWGATGPMPRLGPGPLPRPDSGPMPRAGTGPMPRADTGPIPRLGSGPLPRPDSGPMPRLGSGPLPRAGTGPMPRLGPGPLPRPDSGPMPRAGTGPMPRPAARPGMDPPPRADTGPMPRAGTGPLPRADTGPMPRADTGPMPRVGTGPQPRPAAHSGTGAFPRADAAPVPRPGTGPLPQVGSGPRPRRGRPDVPPGSPAGPAPKAARRPRRADPQDPRNRDGSRPAGGDQWR
jgi:DMSO/TMAO reductase YedYZ heme-binding membrane subunit